MGPIAIREFCQLEIGFLQQQQRGARRGAASSDRRGFEQDGGDASRCKRVRDQSAGHSAADNRNAGLACACEAGVPPAVTSASFEPQRLTVAQASLDRAH
jgi:hypothetical protein